MAQKPNDSKKIRPKKKSGFWNAAMDFFIGGCLAELYVLLVRQYYVYGTNDQLLAWDGYLKTLLYVGLGLLALGIVLTAVLHRRGGAPRSAAIALLCAGAFLAAASWMIRTYYVTAITFLCVMIPAVMLLGILWSLYDRECSWALTFLALDEVGLWFCRKGLNAELWHSRVLAGMIVLIAVLAAAALAFRHADRHQGMLGKLRLLPPDGDVLPVYVACGLSVVSLIVGIFSTVAAYYAMWVVAVVIFALAVYYTVRQL